jgi:hypothetical protein
MRAKIKGEKKAAQLLREASTDMWAQDHYRNRTHTSPRPRAPRLLSTLVHGDTLKRREEKKRKEKKGSV